MSVQRTRQLHTFAASTIVEYSAPNSDSMITDLATLLGDWGQVTEWSAFMDPESPEVNGTDLATLLGAWGPCTAE